MERFIIVLFLTISAAAGYTSAADITTHCLEYTDGERANATVTINTTAVNGQFCDRNSLNEIYFRFFSNNTSTKEYNAAYNPSGPCDGTWIMNVSCVRHENNIITYTLQFVANKTLHSQQYLTVETSCFPVGPDIPFSVNYSSCNPIPFRIADTTISVPVTTLTSTGSQNDTTSVPVTTATSHNDTMILVAVSRPSAVYSYNARNGAQPSSTISLFENQIILIVAVVHYRLIPPIS